MFSVSTRSMPKRPLFSGRVVLHIASRSVPLGCGLLAPSMVPTQP